MDKMLERGAKLLSWAILALMALLVVGSIFNRPKGSLDDLPNDMIREAVNGQS